MFASSLPSNSCSAHGDRGCAQHSHTTLLMHLPNKHWACSLGKSTAVPAPAATCKPAVMHAFCEILGLYCTVAAACQDDSPPDVSNTASAKHSSTGLCYTTCSPCMCLHPMLMQQMHHNPYTVGSLHWRLQGCGSNIHAAAGPLLLPQDWQS